MMKQRAFISRYFRFLSSQKSYLYDWILIALLFIAGISMDTFIEPVQREAPLNDPTIQYSHARQERVQSMWIFVIGPLPIIVICITLILLRRSVHQVHVTILAFILAHACALVLCTTLKLHVGRLRPDFLARCKPSSVSSNQYTYGPCTGDPRAVTEGRKSFPSGHAMQISVAMYFLSFFLLGNVPNPRSKGGRVARLILILLPPYACCFISTTRIADNRHHWEDVVAGTLLAILISYMCYRLYYPCPFSDRHSYIPNIRMCPVHYQDMLEEERRYCVSRSTSSTNDSLSPSDHSCSSDAISKEKIIVPLKDNDSSSEFYHIAQHPTPTSILSCV